VRGKNKWTRKDRRRKKGERGGGREGEDVILNCAGLYG